MLRQTLAHYVAYNNQTQLLNQQLFSLFNSTFFKTQLSGLEVRQNTGDFV